MSESTSVGTIQLDVEINQKSLNTELSKLGNMFNNSFKNMFGGMVSQTNNFVKDSIGRIGNSFKSFAQEGTSSNERISKSVSKLNAQYEKTQAEIRKIQEELATLDAQRDAIIQKYIDMPPISGLTKEETLEQLLSKDEEFARLGARIEELEMKMTPLKDKSRNLAEEIRNAGEQANDTGNKFSNMGNSAKKAAKSIFSLTWLKKLFTRETNKASSASSNFENSMKRVSRIIARNLIVYGLIIKGLRSMISYMWSALKTNEQFANSLNVIRTNLLVAFQPIYEFVLPALNALMQAVATVTTYIAAAISALFGKTYKQSYNAAKGMNTAIKSMGGASKATKGLGKAAKKAGKDVKGALAPFDEINQLMIETSEATPDTGDGGAGGAPGGFEMEMPDLATIDMSGIEKFKEIMSKIFEPFKAAWENEGQNTINAIKYALGEIKELIKAIGRSWLEVWTEGTGQRLIESTLRVLQQIFYIIGDIAKATREAWEENERGTKFIREIHNMIINILDLIEQIAISWRNAWNDGTGRAIMANIIEIATNIVGVIGDIAKSFEIAWTTAGLGNSIMQHIQNIILSILELVNRLTNAFREVWGEVGTELATAFLTVLDSILSVLDTLGEKLVWVWDHGGQHLFEGFLRLGAKILELAMLILSNFVLPFVEWFIGLIAPAVAVVLDAIGWLFDKFAELIDWLMGDGYPVLELIVTVLGSMALAFGIVQGAIAVFNGVMALASGVATVFGAAMAFLTSPIGLVTLAIGAVIAIGKLLYDHWDEISVWIKELWQGIKDKAEEIWNGIAEFFTGLWEGITTTLTEAWEAIVEFLVGIWEGLSESVTEIWTAISEFISGIWESIKEKTSEIWENIKEFLSKLWEGIKTTGETIWNGFKATLETIWNGVKTTVETVWNAIKTFLETLWNGLKTIAETTWNAIKNVIIEPIQNAWAKLKEIWENIKTYILRKWNEIKQGISNMKNALVNAIKEPFNIAKNFINDTIRDAFNWGKNLIGSFVDGIKSMVGKVKDAASSVAGAVKGFLGFHSPAEEGPAKDADKWMPNLMKMLADGIQDNIYEVSAAVNMTAGSIQQGMTIDTGDLAMAVGTAVGGAVSQAMSTSPSGGGDGDIVLKIGETEFGRIAIKAINTEQRRVGKTLLIV